MEEIIVRIVEQLKVREPLSPLQPKYIWNDELDEEIAALSMEGDEYKLAVKAGLHLWNDSQELSHNLSQKLNNDTGSYWHALMHRREGDFSNSKYWYRQVDEHATFDELHATTLVLLRSENSIDRRGKMAFHLDRFESSKNGWNPYHMVEAVEAQTKGRGDEVTRNIFEQIQRLEFCILLRYCYRKGFGGAILEEI